VAQNGFYWQVAQASILLASIISQDGRLCPIHRGPIAMSGLRSLAVHSDSISTAPRTAEARRSLGDGCDAVFGG